MKRKMTLKESLKPSLLKKMDSNPAGDFEYKKDDSFPGENDISDTFHSEVSDDIQGLNDEDFVILDEPYMTDKHMKDSPSLGLGERNDFTRRLLAEHIKLQEESRALRKASSSFYNEKSVPKKEALKTKAFRAGKRAVKKALVRKASRKLVASTHSTIIKLLEANPQLILLAQYLDSDVGRAAVSGLLAVGLEFTPLPEGIRENFEIVKDSLVEELSVMAIDEATMPLEQVVGLLLPVVQQALMPLLTSPEVMRLANPGEIKKLSAKSLDS